MFIGSKEIKATFEDVDNNVKIELDDGYSTVINKDLLALIQTEEKGDGNITDCVSHYFATKFLAELSFYGLNFYFAPNVGTHMGTLAHNLREELFRRTFTCTGADDISLRLLLKEDSLDTKTE